MFGTIANLFGTKQLSRPASKRQTRRLGLEGLEGRDCPAALAGLVALPVSGLGPIGPVAPPQLVVQAPIASAPVRLPASPVIVDPLDPVFTPPNLQTITAPVMSPTSPVVTPLSSIPVGQQSPIVATPIAHEPIITLPIIFLPS